MTYILTQDKMQHTFQSKDKLFYYLDQENAKSKGENLLKLVNIRQVNEAGETLVQKELYLPFVETIDEKLGDFGQNKEKSPSLAKLPQLNLANWIMQLFPATPKMKSESEELLTVSTHITSDQEEEPEVTAGEEVNSVHQAQSVKGDNPVRIFPSLLDKVKDLLPIVALALATASILLILNLALALRTSQATVTHLEKELSTMTLTQEQAGKIDVFSRYFIPVYFSGNSDLLKEFVADERQVEVQNATLQTLIQESITPTNQGYQVVYVLVVEQDGNRKDLRLTFEVSTSKKTYHYEVTNQPKLRDYLQNN